MSQLQDQLENIPGYGVAMDYFNEYAEEHWNAKADPYEDKDGNKVRLPKELGNQRENKKPRKKIQSQAWVDDRCFLGKLWSRYGLWIAIGSFGGFTFPSFGSNNHVCSSRKINQYCPAEFQSPKQTNLANASKYHV